MSSQISPNSSDISPDELLVEPSEETRRGLFVKTYGCLMNEYDSEKVSALLKSSHRLVASAAQADTVFVNTCSVREKGEHKLFSLLGQLKELKEAKPGMVIGVGGCVAQQEGAQLVKRAPFVDFVVGTQNLSLIPSLVSGASAGRESQVAVDYREDWESLPDSLQPFELEHDGVSLVQPQAIRALVSIQRGCNKRCAFCVVPTTRGLEVSRSMDEILRETQRKVGMGAREVLLLGQTVNSYGRDLSPRQSFADLIKRLADIPNLERIRFTSPHPADVRPDFLDLYANTPQLCPHIHLPLQSGSDRILKLMNRSYRSERYLEIVESLLQRCPQIAFSTDVIVGFPTETEEDFQASFAMLERVRYHQVYSFKYSRRPNTVAKDQFMPDQEVDPLVAQDRLSRLQKLQFQHSEERNAELVGQTVAVLIEGRNRVDGAQFRGRSPNNVLVEITASGEGITRLRPGLTVPVHIEHATPHAVRGGLLNEPSI